MNDLESNFINFQLYNFINFLKYVTKYKKFTRIH